MLKNEAIDLIGGLKSINNDIIKTADATANRFAKFTALGQQKMLNKMSERLMNLPGVTPGMDARMTWYLAQSHELRAMLSEVGYFNAVNDYLYEYRKLADLAYDSTALAAAEHFSKMPEEYIEHLRSLDYNHFSVLGNEAIQKIDETLLKGILAGQSRAGMLAELKGVITGDYAWGDRRGLFEWHAGTYARTAASRSAQAFRNTQVEVWNEQNPENQLEHYLYLGPYDAKIRAFCADHFGEVFKKTEIEEMDNGQSGDVMSDRGGWNCRHQWLAVPADLADAIEKTDIKGEKMKEIKAKKPPKDEKKKEEKKEEKKTQGSTKEKDFKNWTNKQLKEQLGDIEGALKKEFGLDVCNLEGIKDVKYVNEWTRALLKYREKHPLFKIAEMVTSRDGRGSCMSVEYLWKTRAMSQEFGFRMNLNLDWINDFSSFKNLQASIANSQSQGWWVAKDYQELIWHECGHVIDKTGMTVRQALDYLKATEGVMNQTHVWINLPSEYANITAANKGVHFTEGFAEWNSLVSQGSSLVDDVTLIVDDVTLIFGDVIGTKEIKGAFHGVEQIIKYLQSRGWASGW